MSDIRQQINKLIDRNCIQPKSFILGQLCSPVHRITVNVEKRKKLKSISSLILIYSLIPFDIIMHLTESSIRYPWNHNNIIHAVIM